MPTTTCLPREFTVRLKFLSDWHVGSGAGRPGDIDRLLVRDVDGLPYVPAKTLRGIWRDACERLALGLDDGKPGEWCRFVDYIFGSQPALGQRDPTGRHHDPEEVPVESALLVRPARMEGTLRQALLSNPALRSALSFVKPGVAIDPQSGTAREDFLRFEEMGRVGTLLEARCVLNVPDGVGEAASALLVAGLALVERLGGKRRRGAGRCAISLADGGALTPQAAADWLEANPHPPAWPHANGQAAVAPAASTSAEQTAADVWMELDLIIELRGPLAVSYRTLGNVVESLDYVPGTYLLPHVTAKLTRLGWDPRPAIARGELCVLPATLELLGQRSRPTPLAWHEPKGASTAKRQIANRFRSAAAEQPQLKQMRDRYVVLSNGQALVARVPKVLFTHNTVEDRLQRPHQDVGGVYTYEAISPLDETDSPVRLRSVLRLRASLARALDQLRSQWWDVLVGRACLGRSKKDDYGEIELRVSPPREAAGAGNAPSSQLCVYLESDVLLRDERLRPAPSAEVLRQELERRLGVALQPAAEAPHYLRVRRLDTWHAGWGLPRPSLAAIQAGSCIQFVVNGALDADRLRAVQAQGIGERRAEGYGRIAFNDPLLQQAEFAQLDSSLPAKNPGHASAGTAGALPASPARIAKDDPAYEYARTLEREHWRHEIYRAALGKAAEATLRSRALGWSTTKRGGEPPMSQLGGLREQLARLLAPGDERQVLGWLEHLRDNQRRSEKWPPGSLESIEKVLTDPRQVWELLQPADLSTLTADGEQVLRKELWPLAVRALFDACIRAHKRELERRGASKPEGVSHGT